MYSDLVLVCGSLAAFWLSSWLFFYGFLFSKYEVNTRGVPLLFSLMLSNSLLMFESVLLEIVQLTQVSVREMILQSTLTVLCTLLILVIPLYTLFLLTFGENWRLSCYGSGQREPPRTSHIDRIERTQMGLISRITQLLRAVMVVLIKLGFLIAELVFLWYLYTWVIQPVFSSLMDSMVWLQHGTESATNVASDSLNSNQEAAVQSHPVRLDSDASLMEVVLSKLGRISITVMYTASGIGAVSCPYYWLSFFRQYSMSGALAGLEAEIGVIQHTISVECIPRIFQSKKAILALSREVSYLESQQKQQSCSDISGGSTSSSSSSDSSGVVSGIHGLYRHSHQHHSGHAAELGVLSKPMEESMRYLLPKKSDSTSLSNSSGGVWSCLIGLLMSVVKFPFQIGRYWSEWQQRRSLQKSVGRKHSRLAEERAILNGTLDMYRALISDLNRLCEWKSEIYKSNHTLSGRMKNVLGYVMALYCIYKVFNSSFSVLTHRQRKLDPITRVLMILRAVLPAEWFGLLFSDERWIHSVSQQLAFLLVGAIIAATVRGILVRLLRMIDFIQGFLVFDLSFLSGTRSGIGFADGQGSVVIGGSTQQSSGLSSNSAVIVLALTEIMGLYFVSALLVLRMYLPIEYRAFLTRLLGPGLDFQSYYQWSDTVFLVSAFLTLLLIVFSFVYKRFRMSQGFASTSGWSSLPSRKSTSPLNDLVVHPNVSPLKPPSLQVSPADGLKKNF